MKRYLVPFEGSDLSDAALRYAIQITTDVPGTLDIIYIADERVLINPIWEFAVLALQGIGTLGDIQYREKVKLELKTKLISRGEDILEELAEWPELNQEKENPISYSTRVDSGNPPKYISEISENYDIVFMGLWGEMHKHKLGLWGGTSEAVIRKGTSPVFLSTGPYVPLESIVIGFDNRPRARQSLAWAGMLGENLKLPVKVVTSSTDEGWRDEAVREAKEIAGSYETEFTFDASSKNAAEAVLDASSPGSLICMGAFGDQPIRELFLGSVAEEVLRRAKSPVLLLK